MNRPSIESLRENFIYDGETLAWRVSGSGRDLSRSLKIKVEFEHHWYRVSHVVWAMHYGEWPSGFLYHVNGNRYDIRICNLENGRGVRHEYKRPDLTDSEIKEMFIYNEFDGSILRRVCDQVVACEKDVVINGKEYRRASSCFLSHRLAWFLHYGEWPKQKIDHEDHNGRNNRIKNLRDVSHGENLKNAKRSKRNKTGITGVCVSAATGKYVAQIGVNGVVTPLGSYDTLAEAAEVRRRAEVQYGFHPNHGK